MFQNHKILMYKEKCISSEDETAEFLYDIMIRLCNASDTICVSPRYECNNKKNHDEFEWSRENFRKYLNKNRVKVNDKIICYSLSFFSNQDEDRSSNITIQLSCDDKCLSVLNLSLSYNVCTLLYSDEKICEDTESLFIGLCEKFDPFYACIKNDRNITGKLFEDSTLLPTQLHWLNFFSYRKYSDMCIDSDPYIYVNRLSNGMAVKFGKRPVDVEDEECINNQKRCFESLILKNE